MKKQLSHQQLELKADNIRQDILRMLEHAGSGHSAGPLGMADIFTALYFDDLLQYNPKKPDWAQRDRLVLSNGHINPVLYVTMAHAGYFDRTELKTLRKFGTRLQGHPERTRLPGIETTSGPLGSGISQAAGMAYGLLMAILFRPSHISHHYCHYSWLGHSIMQGGFSDSSSSGAAVITRSRVATGGSSDGTRVSDPVHFGRPGQSITFAKISAISSLLRVSFSSRTTTIASRVSRFATRISKASW